MDLPTWLLIIPVLGFLIFVHELGHFLTAKRFGIKVTEFGFGFPPRIFGVRYGETLYSVNWIPVGGFVRMVGEEDPTDPRSFARQSVLRRVIVLCAGSFMNLVVPVVIFTVLFVLPHDTQVGGDVAILSIAPGSPAQKAGLRAGDVVLSINGYLVATPDKTSDRIGELIDRIRSNRGIPTQLTVRRGAAATGLGSSPEFSPVETVTVIPRLDPPRLKVVEEVTDPSAVAVPDPSTGTLTLNPNRTFSYQPGGSDLISETQVSLAAAKRYDSDLEVGDTLRQGAVGFGIGVVNAKVDKTTDPLWEAFPKSFTTIWDVLAFTRRGLAQGLSSGSNPGVAGPIGIAQATGEIVSELGISWVFQLTALISISLGILNILPIPALDGGRLAFVLIEWVRRGKRISPEREGLVHLIGFVILIGLVVFISYHDVLRLLNGDSFIR